VAVTTDDIPGLLEVDVPYFSLSIYDNFTTADDQDLETNCNDAYTLDWRAQVDSMVVTLNEQLASGELCPNESGQINVVLSTTMFISQGNQVNVESMHFTKC
jgi:hypothetical protein